MKKVYLFLLSLSCIPLSAANYKTSSCQDAEFAASAWKDITTVEPRIQEHLNFIAEKSGDTSSNVVNLTNCHVQLPVDFEGNAVPGDRIVTMDKVWEERENGQFVKQIAGMRIVFSERIRTRIPKKEWVWDPAGYYVERTVYVESVGRRIQGFSICAGNSCDSLAIPYAGAIGSNTALLGGPAAAGLEASRTVALPITTKKTLTK